MASSSSKASKRKRAENENDFFSCMGLGVPDSYVRTIMSKLKKDTSWENSYWRSEKIRFKNSLDNIMEEVVEGKDGAQVTIYVNNLQKYMDSLVHQAPAYSSFLQRILSEEQRKTPDGVHAILYVDECVPGNILQPDNQRKSYCMYFCFRCLADFRSILHWWPVALLRHSQIDLLQDGLPEFFTRAVRLLVPILSGLLLENETLIVTKKIFLIADEAALKAVAGSKGASGLRPCLHCDAFSKDRSNMASSLGTASIACSTFGRFRVLPDSDILDVLQHLQQVRDTQTKSALEEAQKTARLGFERISLLSATRYLCLFTAYCISVRCDALLLVKWPGQLRSWPVFFTGSSACQPRQYTTDTFFERTWRRTQIRFEKSCSLQSLFHHKLLRKDSDYKGDAVQTLEILPLLAFFASQELQYCQELAPNIQSLVALWHVTTHILNAKQNIDAIHGLQRLQEIHLEYFVQAYSEEKVRPKHHFAGHIEQQALETGVLLDCFPGERKNKTFKNVLCPNISRLQGFEKAVLLRWLEYDLQSLETFTDNVLLLAQFESIGNVRVGKGLRCYWGEIKAGHILLLNETTAVEVLGCTQENLV